MTCAYRRGVSYGDRTSRLERLREIESGHRELTDLLAQLEEVWNDCGQSFDERRESCTAVVMALSMFAREFGVSDFASERLNDLGVALGELMAGRNSALLQRADRPTRTPAATDLMNQAIAQVCVDLFRAARLSADQARKRTARLFLAKGFKNFGVSKIKSLGPRLTGRGCEFDPAIGEYQMMSSIAHHMLAMNGCQTPLSEAAANEVVRNLLDRARVLDHRLAA